MRVDRRGAGRGPQRALSFVATLDLGNAGERSVATRWHLSRAARRHALQHRVSPWRRLSGLGLVERHRSAVHDLSRSEAQAFCRERRGAASCRLDSLASTGIAARDAATIGTHGRVARRSGHVETGTIRTRARGCAARSGHVAIDGCCDTVSKSAACGAVPQTGAGSGDHFGCGRRDQRRNRVALARRRRGGRQLHRG